MGKLRIPCVTIKEVDVNLEKVADTIYQYCVEDGYIDEFIDNEVTPEEAAHEMYDDVDVRMIVEDNLPIEIDPGDVVWDSDYLEDEIYASVINLLIKKVKNDLIKK